VFLGRVAPEKGVVDLIEATWRLKTIGCPISFLVAGPALDSADAIAFVSSLKRRIYDLSLDDSIALIGLVAHPLKARLLAAADVVVCPSRWEASPMVVVEALASGVPVVGYRVGGLEEQIQDGETGFLVEPGSVSGIVEAVDRLMKSDSLRTEMGHRGREEVLRLYTVSSLVARHVDLYSAIRSTETR
jgi:glycosyltransferase involved in cell wall biosynthesis